MATETNSNLFSGCVRVNVQYRSKTGLDQEIQFALDPNVPIRVTIGQLTKVFSAAGLPNAYALCDTKLGKALSQVRKHFLRKRIQKVLFELETK